MYEKALAGEQDARVKSFEELRALCQLFHFVQPAEHRWQYFDCPENPDMRCDCKGYKGYGICSHILTIQHMLKFFNVRYELLPIGKKRMKKTGGNMMFVEPALTRVPTREPDSSDDEEEEAIRLGEQGL